MSTIIIITPPPKKPPSLVAREDGGADVLNSEGVTIATFANGDQAIAYLRSIKKLEGLAE